MAQLRRHGSRWQARVYVGRQGDRDVYKYPSWPGEMSKREAQKALKVLEGHYAEQRQRMGGSFDGRTATLNELWADYRELRLFSPTAAMSEETRAEYEKNWRLHLQPALGTMTLGNITPKVVDTLVNDLSIKPKQVPGGAGRKRPQPTRTPEPLSPATVRKVTKLLASMLSAAIRWGWIDGPNPVGMSSGRTEVTPSTVRAPSPEVVRALLVSARELGLANLVFFRLASVTGARRGELAALTWGDIDLDGGTLSISKAMQSSRVSADERHTTIDQSAPTKTRRNRVVMLDDETRDELRSYLAETVAGRAAARLDTSDAGMKSAYVFASDPAGQHPISKTAWSARWRRVQSRANVTGVRLHDLRHFVGVNLAKNGIPLRDVMSQLGHSRLSTTEIYLVNPASSAGASVMANILNEPPQEPRRRQRR